MKNMLRFLLNSIIAVMALALLPTTHILAQEAGGAAVRPLDAPIVILMVGGVAALLMAGLIYNSYQNSDSGKGK